MQKLCKKNACLIYHLIAQGDYPTKGILIILTIPSRTCKKCPRIKLNLTVKYSSHLEAVLEGL